MLTVVICLVVLALLFDFINGFHDAANSIATIIATRVLKPWQALLYGAFFNFLAFFIFPLHVAMTIGTGIVEQEYISNVGITAVLLAAITFNLITWWLKLPSSSSHALIGALIGLGLVQAGFSSLELPAILIIFASVFISPAIGMLLAYVLVKIIPRIHPGGPNVRFYKILQLFSSALVSLGHGGNDAQKTMGVIFVLLQTNGYLLGDVQIPLWVALSCYTMIALGTLTGGWRIIETVGYKITKLKPPSGACAEFGSAFTLFMANNMGIPVSTTYVVTGSVVGVSSYNAAEFKSTNWQIVKHIFIAWLITVPTCILFSAGIFWVLAELF